MIDFYRPEEIRGSWENKEIPHDDDFQESQEWVFNQLRSDFSSHHSSREEDHDLFAILDHGNPGCIEPVLVDNYLKCSNPEIKILLVGILRERRRTLRSALERLFMSPHQNLFPNEIDLEVPFCTSDIPPSYLIAFYRYVISKEVWILDGEKDDCKPWEVRDIDRVIQLYFNLYHRLRTNIEMQSGIKECA